MAAVPKEDLPSAVPEHDLPGAEEPRPEKEKPSALQSIGEAAASGFGLGAFAPELMETAGVGLTSAGRYIPGMPGKVATGIGAGLTAGGEALRGSRVASAVGGGISGATGETAGQVVESKYGPGVGAETARLLGSVVGPEPFYQLGKLPTGVKSLFGMLPGGKTARTLGDLLQEKGISSNQINNLSQQQQEFVQRKLKDIRGTDQASLQAEKDIVDLFRKQAQTITQTAEQQATTLEQQANAIIQQAQTGGRAAIADANKKVAALRSQWDAAADKLRSQAQVEARTQIEAGAKRAAIIRRNSQNQSSTVRQLAEIDAKQTEDQARQAADKIIQDSAKQIATTQKRLEAQQERLRKFGAATKEQQAQEIGKVGERILPTELGGQIRPLFDKQLKSLVEAREAAFKPFKDAWLNSIKNLEGSGKTYRDIPGYQETLNKIDTELIDPTTRMTRQTDPKVVEQIKRVKDQINPVRRGVDPNTGEVFEAPVKASAESLETLVRRLKDRAAGLPAEGVEAIDQQLAGRLADYTQKLIDDFSGGAYNAAKNAYKELSRPLNEFRTRLGRYVTDKPEGFDLGDYMEKLSGVGGQVFGNANTARQLLSVAGLEESNRLARGYLADQIGEPTKNKIRSVLETNRDWLALPEFKTLRTELESVAKNIEKTTDYQKRLDILERTLKTKVSQVPGLPEKEAARVEQRGLTEAERIRRDAERAAGRIEAGAEKRIGQVTPSTEALRQLGEQQVTSGAKAVESRAATMQAEAAAKAKQLETEAGQVAAPLTKEAQKVRQEAQKKVDELLADTTASDRVEKIITGSKQSEWQAMGEILRNTPGGQDKFSKAVSQVIAREAERSLKGAINKMQKIGDRAVEFGLMDQKAVDALQKKLSDIFVAPIDQLTKTTMLQRAIKNAFVFEVGRPAQAVVDQALF